MRPGPAAAAAFALLLIPGCDIAGGVAAGVYAARRDSSSSSGAPAAALPPDVAYRVWIADLPDAAAATAQESALLASNGAPDPLVWTQIGSDTRSRIFDPGEPPGSFNSVLIQAGDAHTCFVDAVEILDAPEAVVLETAAAPFHAGQTAFPGRAAGPPDGLAAELSAAPGTKAFLFSRFSGPIDKFRVNAWGPSRAPGDLLWVATWNDAGDETPGGAALDAFGTLHLTVSDSAGAARDVRLLRIDGFGSVLAPMLIAGGVTAAAGGHATALHPSDGSVYVAATVAAGDILVRRYPASLGPAIWTQTFDSGAGLDRVHFNAIAVDAAGDAVVAGGAATALAGIDPWIRKFAAANGGTLWTQTPPPFPVDSGDTYFHAVALDAAGDVYAAGDLTSTASGFVEILTRRSAGSNGNPVWSDLLGDNQSPADLGRAAGVDAAGNVYVGGYLGSASQGRNGVLLKYAPGGFLSALATFDDQNVLDDEVADVAVEPDGTVFAAGYATAAGQGRNLWIRKYDPRGASVWTRTYDGGAGDDEGLSVVAGDGFVVVAGYRTEPGGEKNVHVRRYVK